MAMDYTSLEPITALTRFSFSKGNYFATFKALKAVK